MGGTLIERQVNCGRCRFRFVVQVPPSDDWRVEAQCPRCDGWACFTAADTPERERPPEPKRPDPALQRLGERLWKPINEHRTHPAVAWFDRVGNGVFEDDHSECCWPAPWWSYRFTRGSEAAYIWQEEDSWFVRSWHPMRGRRKPPDPVEVLSFKEALDQLARTNA